jgi:hypothetical protein
MFGFFKFFKKRPPDDPPTEKQRRYAAMLGIEVPATMTRKEISAVIAYEERRNPALTEKRERAKLKAREKQFGKELVDDEARWNRFADEVGYALAIYFYSRRKILPSPHGQVA